MSRRILGSLLRSLKSGSRLYEAEFDIARRGFQSSSIVSSLLAQNAVFTRSCSKNSIASVLSQTRYSSSYPGWESVLYPESELEVGGPAPDFSLEAVVDGEITTVNLSDYKGKYVVLFWYPKDFTFVCPTEIIAFSDRAKEFETLNCQLLAASTDSPEVHLAWIKTPRTSGGLGYMRIPILSDITKSVAARYGVLKQDVGIALRGLYIINPEGIVEHATINNFPIGRSVDEALRTLQAIQHVAEHGEVCPAGWKPGDQAMIADPEKSLEYFQNAASSHKDEDEKSSLHAIQNASELQDLIASGEKVMVKFWAPWCGKCRQIGPFVEDLATKYGDKMKVVSVDTTAENLDIYCNEIGVKGLPAFRFYADGKEVEELRVMGYKKQVLEEKASKFSA